MPEMKAVCKDCNEPFVISEGEQAWYTERGWELPKRCKDCRREAKMMKKEDNEK